MMIDAKKLLDQFLGSNVGGVNAGDALNKAKDYATDNKNSLATGALVGGLAAMLLGTKTGRKMTGSAVKLGGVALVGGLAYKAYKDWQAGKPPLGMGAGSDPLESAPSETGFHSQDDAVDPEFGLAVVRAMINAAKADGIVTNAERALIEDKFAELSLDQDEIDFLRDELDGGLDLENVVKSVKTREQAVEIYMASLLAIGEANAAEDGYLAMLAARLQLEPELIAHLKAARDTL